MNAHQAEQPSVRHADRGVQNAPQQDVYKRQPLGQGRKSDAPDTRFPDSLKNGCFRCPTKHIVTNLMHQARNAGLPVKPDPALFLKAAENLGKSPSDCLVLEESQNGTTAAHRAGMPVISVPNRVTEQADFSLATSIIRSLTELL